MEIVQNNSHRLYGSTARWMLSAGLLCLLIIGCSGEPVTVVVEEEKSGMAAEVVLGSTMTAEQANTQGTVDTTPVLVNPQPVPSPAPTSQPAEKKVETPTNNVILSPTANPVETKTPSPVPTALHEPPAATAEVAPAPAVATPIAKEVPSATPVPETSPTATAAPSSEPTAEPRTDDQATSASIAVVTLDSQERYEKHGFSLSTGGATRLIEGGRDLAVADDRQGMVAFQHGSSLAILEWSTDLDGSYNEFLRRSYASLKSANTNWSYAELNEGTLTVDGMEGAYGFFAAGDNVSDLDAFGLIAAWECTASERKFAFSFTGMEPTVVQVRFRTLLDSFDCG